MATPAERLIHLLTPHPIDSDKVEIITGRFLELAYEIVEHTPAGPEQTVALRALLDSKHAAIRALVPVEAEVMAGVTQIPA